MIAADAVKVSGLMLFVALLQVSVATPLEVANGHPDVVLVVLVAVALLRGPTVGAIAGFWAGLVIDVAAFQTLGLSSLVLTLAGYAAGRFGEATSRRSSHPPLIAVALATVAVALASAVFHFMLGERVPASELLGRFLLPTLALNVLLAYPLYRLTRRVFPTPERERRREVLVG